jgi:hypothetical protein
MNDFQNIESKYSTAAILEIFLYFIPRHQQQSVIAPPLPMARQSSSPIIVSNLEPEDDPKPNVIPQKSTGMGQRRIRAYDSAPSPVDESTAASVSLEIQSADFWDRTLLPPVSEEDELFPQTDVATENMYLTDTLVVSQYLVVCNFFIL